LRVETPDPLRPFAMSQFQEYFTRVNPRKEFGETAGNSKETALFVKAFSFQNKNINKQSKIQNTQNCFNLYITLEHLFE
jgi:hypothetical protein